MEEALSLPIPNRSEIGARCRTVREMAHLSARRLRLALGSQDSNLVSDIEEGKKKIVDFVRLAEIAQICAGQGQLEGVEWEEVLDYITGRVKWDIRPQVRPAGDDGDDSATGSDQTRRFVGIGQQGQVAA